MFRRKTEYEDEKREMPLVWTVVIAILFLVCAFGGACWLTGIAEKHEMAEQYGYVEE